MQPSRRKRDRGENEDKGALVAPASRTRGARGAPAQKKLHISHEHETGSNTEEGNGASVTASRERSEEQSGRNSDNAGNAVQQQSMPLDAAVQKNESEEGNDQSMETEKSTQNASLDEQNDVESKASPSGKQAQKSALSGEPKGQRREVTNPGKEDSLEQRILPLLEHRRMLLDRIKKCRLASENRLKSVVRQKNHEKKEAEKATEGKTSVSERNSLGKSDDDEVAAFKELSRKAINAAKKQRADAAAEGQQQEKRAPISLRRGSSVGKRMSMALSSLAPHAPVGPSASTKEPQKLPLHQQNSAPAPALPHREGAFAGNVLLPSTVSSSSRGDARVGLSAHPVGSHSVIQSSKGTSSYKQQPLLPSPAAVLAASEQVAHAGRSGSGHATQKIKRQKSKSYGATSIRGPGSSSTSEPQTSKAYPLHFGAAGSTLPQNRLAQTSVIYPEAMALRERRNFVRSQLASLLYERQKRLEEVDVQPSISQQQNKQFSAQAFQHAIREKRAPSSFASVLSQQRGPGPPSALPRRRKAHWDYLLEEMRWLATDFIEERKWKASCARTLSSAVISNGRNSVSAIASKSLGDGQNQKAGKHRVGEAVTQDSQVDMETDEHEGKSDFQNTVDNADNAEATSKEYRLYKSLSSTDEKNARVTATIMSDMIAELWDVTAEVGVTSKADASHKISLKRHLKRRQKVEEEHSTEITSTFVQADSKVSDGEVKAEVKSGYESGPEPSSACTLKSARSSNEKPDVSSAQAEDLSYDQITERVQGLVDTAKNRMVECDVLHPKQFGRYWLTQPQITALELVKSIWGDDGLPGAILNGPAGSGKTIAVCSLLWRQREDGPQMLICPPARLIRWKHELCQFAGLRIFTLGSHCGISSPELTRSSTSVYGPGDVVLCEYASVDAAMESLTAGDEEMAVANGFSTIALDCRHPSASLVTIDNYSTNSAFIVTKDEEGFQGLSPELLTNAWWGKFNKSVSSMATRRLLIEWERYGKNQKETFFGCADLEARPCLEYLSAKAAFVLGPALFYSNHHSVTKKVLSWAKRRVKAERQKEGTLDDVLEEMKSLLARVLVEFSHSLQGISLREDRKGRLEWGVRLCSLPPLQRSEYDKCCASVRGALSSERFQNDRFRHSANDPNTAAACALLRLRQVCVHAHLQDAPIDFSDPGTIDVVSSELRRGKNWTTGSSIVSASGSWRFHRKALRSSSQPNVELALDILKSSAKLRDLLGILRFECGYHLHGEDSLVSTFDPSLLSEIRNSQAKPEKSSQRKKVAILAALPEAQLLTSLLLSSVGIAHELLMRLPSAATNHTVSATLSEVTTTSDAGPLKREPETRRHPDATLSWTECQLALARFNSGYPTDIDTEFFGEASFSKALKRMGSVDVIVTSPVTVASHNGGIGIPSADLVVSLDEDWSGRGQMFMSSILSMQQTRCGASNGRTRTGKYDCKFLRLVCTNTCEEKFGVLFQDKLLVEDLSMWPVDKFGYLCFPPSYSTGEASKRRKVVESTTTSECTQHGTFPFPGTGMAKFRNADLSSVLCSEQPLPSDFVTGSKLYFLPTPKFADGKLDTVGQPEKVVQEPADVQLHVSFVLALMRYEAWSCPLSSLHPPSRKTGTGIIDNPSLNWRYLAVVPPLPAHFPPGVVTRQDLFALSSRVYIESFGRSLLWDNLGAMSTSPVGAMHVQPDTMFAPAPSEDNVELADAWHKSGLSCKPDDLAASLLVYSPPRSGTEYQDSVDFGTMNLLDKKKSQHASSINVIAGEQNQLQNEGNTITQGYSSTATAAVGHDHKLGYRSNVYSARYSSARNGRSTVVRDGNQGCEPHVYFPPLFPNMRLCAEIAKGDIAALRSVRSLNKNESKLLITEKSERENGVPKKRKGALESDFALLKSGKRPRIQHVPTSSVLTNSNTVGQTIQQLQPISVVTATTTLGSVDSNTLEPSIIPKDNCSLNDAALYLFSLDEDYGLVGIGALAMPFDAATTASLSPIDASAYTTWKDPFEPTAVEHNYLSIFLPCDTEEAATSPLRGPSTDDLNSMILFVARKNLVGPWGPGTLPTSSSQFFSAANSVGAGAQSSSATWSSTNASSRAAVSSGPGIAGSAIGNGLVNGSGAVKKKKKIHSQGASLAASSAFSHLPSGGFPAGASAINTYSTAASLQAAKEKVGYSNKFLSQFTGRHGRTLFDHSSFKFAYVRIRKRVSDRVSHSILVSSLSSGIGPGVPLILLKTESATVDQPHQMMSANELRAARWTSVVSELSEPGDVTGLCAKTQSVFQRAALRRSLVSPRRVDFGPFQAGYLSLSSGMTAVSPLNARVGVSLPMGVKIPNQQREKQLLPWSAAEDKKLQGCAVRFGLNFHLAARAVSGVEVVRPPPQSQRVTTRSARQCRERWNRLIKDQPSLANEVRRSERALRENATLTPEQVARSLRGFRPQRNLDSSDGVFIKKGSLVRRFGDCAILTPESQLAHAKGSKLKPPLEHTEIGDGDKKPSGSTELKAAKHPRSFASFRSAASKKQDVQITIPGCIGGDGPPSLVPSHPSHLQSIQAAVAGTKSFSGRSDMWPLQILDMVYKQRDSTSERKASQATGVTSSSSANISRPQASAAVSGVPRPNGSATPQANQALQQQASAYPQQVQHAQARSSHHQRIAPAAASPARSPHRTPSAMAAGLASPAVNQQFVAPQPPGRTPSTDAHAASLATSGQAPPPRK